MHHPITHTNETERRRHMAGKRRNNGAGHIRQKPDGRWEALYYARGERRYITGKKGESAVDVQKRLNEALHNLDRGIETPRDNRQTFGEYLDGWLVTKKPSVEYGYWERLESYIRLHIKPILGKVPLTKLTAQQLQTLYAQKLEAGQAPNTVKHLHNAVHVALRDALRLDLVARNVADLVHAPTAAHVEMQIYSRDEAIRLLRAARGERNEAMFILMLTAGCRLGELLGLRWEAIDFDRSELRIVTALKDVRNKRTLSQPKTQRSRRTIPLTALALEALKRHHVKQTEERLAHGPGWNPDRLVFCTTHGTAYARSNWNYQQWRPLIAKAGLPYRRPHDMRHTFSTLQLQGKTPMLTVSKMLGHTSPAFTASFYGHVTDDMAAQAVQVMEQLGNQMVEGIK
jgi:integrase